MGWIPSPHVAGDRPTYIHVYQKILSDHRRSPDSSADSVIMLVAPNVDALCAARMFVTLFKQDDVKYRIIPVSGRIELERVAEDLRANSELLNLILLNMGGTYDLPTAMWFGDFNIRVNVHVIDSARPQSLTNLFMGGANADRIIMWDDGSTELLMEEKKAWEIGEYEAIPDSDDDDEDTGDDETVPQDDEGESESVDAGSPSRKRRKETPDSPQKRRRKNEDRPKLTAGEWDLYQQRLDGYYSSGISYGSSVASMVYSLATQLERTDNDLLWLAILGVTYQYITSKIPRTRYDTHHTVYRDEVSRLNPQPAQQDVHALLFINPDDVSVRSSEELRFTHFRHWTLYDAMFHSSYVAGKLGIWKERGRSRLTGLLAKMGLSITQAQQTYSHMDMDLKKTLIQKLDEIAPEYGLVELSFPSFIRCFGFHTQPLSAADAVESIDTLLDVAEGIRIEVEIEGTRNGGEWFGAGRVWEANASTKTKSTKKAGFSMANGGINSADNIQESQADEEQSQESEWWVKNFWIAYDALSDIASLRQSLKLSMAVHRAVIRTGTSIIDKQDIKTLRHTKVVVLNQGPDLALFVHPGLLTRLALWLIDALRDRMPMQNDPAKRKKRGLPLLLACLNEAKQRYTVVGVTASPDYGQFQRNRFTLAFHQAVDNCTLDSQYGSFDASVIEIHKEDLKVFLESVGGLI